MPPIENKLQHLAQLIDQQIDSNGLHQTTLENLILFRESQGRGREQVMYEPALIIAAQGRKYVYLDGTRYEYNAGQFLALFMPMAVECEIIEASEEKPMLGLGIRLYRHRLAKLLLKMDGANPSTAGPEAVDTSGIFSAPLKDNLLDAAIRLVATLDDPAETAILGEALIDEIYFRILTEEQGGSLRVLLRQQGQIQQISRAVEHLHDNLHKSVSVEELAGLVNMSQSGFHKKFKQVMHLSPLQYTKLVRLNKARTLILEGNSVSDAAYHVGYNSPAQFSREYKRFFGFAPSAT